VRSCARFGFVASALLLVLVALPACSKDSGGKTISVAVTPAGCDPFDIKADPGKTTFNVENKDANDITEIELLLGDKVVGEKENLTPGLTGSFDVDLQAGQTYTLLCPGGTQHAKGTVVVSGGSASGSGSASSEAAGSNSSSNGACPPAPDLTKASSNEFATLKDFTINLASPELSQGSIAINAANTGPSAHEIVIVKGIAPGDLPTKSDGSVDEDKLPPGAKVGELEKFAPGNTCSALFDMPAGDYTLFCNIVDATGSHFKQGMVTTMKTI
jgi:hypothetical protein